MATALTARAHRTVFHVTAPATTSTIEATIQGQRPPSSTMAAPAMVTSRRRRAAARVTARHN